MTETCKRELIDDLALIRKAIDAHDYAQALSASSLLTLAGHGVPAFTSAYWHAKQLQHELYYYGTWSHSLAEARPLIRLINDEVRRMKPIETL